MKTAFNLSLLYIKSAKNNLKTTLHTVVYIHPQPQNQSKQHAVVVEYRGTYRTEPNHPIVEFV